MNGRYNVVLAGKTGTGKSSLVNYIYGEDVAHADIGGSQTKKGFHPYHSNFGELPVCLYDTWGLEVHKANEWYAILEKELSNRGTDKPVYEWFHTVFYCIQASGHRIEPFEEKIIKLFLNMKYKVIVILTKADAISHEDEDKFKSIIRSKINENIPIIPVCSIHSKTRLGETNPFGFHDVMDAIFNDFWDTLKDRLPDHCIYPINKVVTNWKKSTQNYIESALESYFLVNYKEIEGQLEIRFSKLESFLRHDVKSIVQSQIIDSIKAYLNISEKLLANPIHLDKIEINNEQQFILNKIKTQLQSSNFYDMIDKIIVGLLFLFPLGSLLKAIYDILYRWLFPKIRAEKTKKELLNRLDEMEKSYIEFSKKFKTELNELITTLLDQLKEEYKDALLKSRK